METPAINTPEVVPGQEATPASPQATVTPSQEGFQPQGQPTPQVEGAELQAPSQDDARRASDFETARQLKRMMKEMQSLKQTFERVQAQNVPQANPPVKPMPQITNDDVVKDPIGAIRSLLQAELQGFRSEIPQHFQQFSEQQRLQQAQQEAVRLIETNSSVKADPEGVDRIKDILTEEDDFGNSLEKYASSNPRHAAQLALKEYQNRFMGGKRSQSAPTKAQMQTTATAVTPGMPKSTGINELKELERQVMNNPELIKDTEFLKKIAGVRDRHKLEELSQGK